MNTVLTEEELELQKIYKEYADERIRPHTLESDKGLFSVEPLLKEMHELGFCGIVIPKEYGGLGSSYVHYVLAVEELSKASGPLQNPFPARRICASPSCTTVPRLRSKNMLCLGSRAKSARHSRLPSPAQALTQRACRRPPCLTATVSS